MADGSVRARRDVRPAPHPGRARRHEGRRSPRSPAARTALAVGPDGALLPVQQRRVLHAGRVGGLLFPGPFDPDRYIGGRIQRVDLATGDGDRPVHRVRRPPAAGAERPRVRRPRRLLVHRPRHPRRRRTQRPAPASTTPRPTARRSRRWCSRPTRPTASACRPTATPLYWAETHTGRVFQRTVDGAGRARAGRRRSTRRCCLAGLPGLPAARLAGRRRRRQRLRGHARQRRDHGRSRPTARSSSTSPTGDLAHDQHLLRRRRTSRTAFITAVGHRPARCRCRGRGPVCARPLAPEPPAELASAAAPAGSLVEPCRSASTSRRWAARRTRSTPTS